MCIVTIVVSQDPFTIWFDAYQETHDIGPKCDNADFYFQFNNCGPNCFVNCPNEGKHKCVHFKGHDNEPNGTIGWGWVSRKDCCDCFNFYGMCAIMHHVENCNEDMEIDVFSDQYKFGLPEPGDLKIMDHDSNYVVFPEAYTPYQRTYFCAEWQNDCFENGGCNHTINFWINGTHGGTVPAGVLTFERHITFFIFGLLRAPVLFEPEHEDNELLLLEGYSTPRTDAQHLAIYEMGMNRTVDQHCYDPAWISHCYFELYEDETLCNADQGTYVEVDNMTCRCECADGFKGHDCSQRVATMVSQDYQTATVIIGIFLIICIIIWVFGALMCIISVGFLGYNVTIGKPQSGTTTTGFKYVPLMMK